MRARLHLITLGVGALARALRFYADGLGWQPSAASVEGVVAFFQLGGVVLALYPREQLALDAGLSPEGQGFAGISLAHNTRSREEVDALLQLAQDSGGALVRPAAETAWGGYVGYFADPDGHLWEVAWNPGFPFDE